MEVSCDWWRAGHVTTALGAAAAGCLGPGPRRGAAGSLRSLLRRQELPRGPGEDASPNPTCFHDKLAFDKLQGPHKLSLESIWL